MTTHVAAARRVVARSGSEQKFACVTDIVKVGTTWGYVEDDGAIEVIAEIRERVDSFPELSAALAVRLVSCSPRPCDLCHDLCICDPLPSARRHAVRAEPGMVRLGLRRSWTTGGLARLGSACVSTDGPPPKRWSRAILEWAPRLLYHYSPSHQQLLLLNSGKNHRSVRRAPHDHAYGFIIWYLPFF